jgi:hypothetical protein
MTALPDMTSAASGVRASATWGSRSGQDKRR